MKLKFKIILTLASIFLAANANASALKITPSSVYLDAVFGRTEQKILTIENPGSDVALFEIYSDDFSNWISVNPTSFILNPGEKKEALISVNFRKEGIYATALSVVSKPLSERGFKTNAGVKIPLEIRVSENKPELWLASILENFERLFKNHQNLIYIFSGIFILALSGYLILRNKKVKL